MMFTKWLRKYIDLKALIVMTGIVTMLVLVVWPNYKPSSKQKRTSPDTL